MNPTKPGVLTSEFWVALAALAGKIATLIFTIRTVSFIDPNGQNAYMQAISAAILGIGTIWGITHGAANYTTNRTKLKQEAVIANSPNPQKILDYRAK